MKLSVIIPVYNSQKFLNTCIESVVNQTYSNLELIIINDGSTDESGKICDEWAKRDSRIKVYHQKNSGVSAARNKGIELATGNYIAFVDSDDLVTDNWLETTAKEAELNNCDIICYRFNKRNSDEDYFITDFIATNQSDLRLKFNDIFEVGVGSVCTQIYKRELLKTNNIIFNHKIVLNEETFFNLECFKKMKSFQYINNVLYFYTENQLSSSRKGNLHYLKIVKEKVAVYTSFLEEMQLGEIAKKTPKGMLQDGVYAHFLQAAVSTNSLSYKQRIAILKEIYFDKDNYYNLMNAKRFKVTSFNLFLCKVSAICKTPFIIAAPCALKKYLTKEL